MAASAKAKSVRICDVDDGKRPVYLTQSGMIKVGANGKLIHPVRLSSSVPKGTARKIRKTLRSMGRMDLVQETLVAKGA